MWLVKSAFPGAVGLDILAPVSAALAKKLAVQTNARPRFDFFVRYLAAGSSFEVTREEIDRILDLGYAMQFVTLGGWRKSAPVAAIDHALALGIPKGAMISLDLEAQDDGTSATRSPEAVSHLAGEIDRFAQVAQAAGYLAGLYVGPGCLLTSAEIYARKVTRYWRAASSLHARDGSLVEPSCGFCQSQLEPAETLYEGVKFDLDVVHADFRGRLPTWIRKAA